MAGLGFKDFQVGEVLTSADVDGYLMQQTVMRFADSAARGSALGTATGTAVPLAEGMLSYLDDSDAVEVYDGSAWVGVGSFVQSDSVYKTTTFSTSSTSYVDFTDLSITMTPSSSGSKFLLVFNLYRSAFAVADNAATFDFDRSGTGLGLDAAFYYVDTVVEGGQSVVHVDSPATTSSVTYKVRAKVGASTFSGFKAHFFVAEVSA